MAQGGEQHPIESQINEIQGVIGNLNVAVGRMAEAVEASNARPIQVDAPNIQISEAAAKILAGNRRGNQGNHREDDLFEPMTFSEMCKKSDNL